MKALVQKFTSFVAGGIALLIGGMMVGLGLVMAAFLAMFALAALGLAMIATPFIAKSEEKFEEGEEIDLPPEAEAAPAS